ncbi:MAG: Rrf2 family transcriptional regulator [Patescibacteria group bacterium]
MFNISTKSDYGLIVMSELAKKYPKDYLSLTDIAKDKKLSPAYLTQIIQPLIKTKLIASKEGKGGGYKLLKAPAQISILEIIEALEGPANLVKCLRDKKVKCSCFLNCEIKSVWPVIIEAVKKSITDIKLSDLI